mgnify:CR=1 FL=1
MRGKAKKILETQKHPRECYYCHIKEEDFHPIFGDFYGGNRGKKLEVDHKDNDFRNKNTRN